MSKVREGIEKNSPWLPAKPEIVEAAAIQALLRGDATEEQQKRAMQWIIEKVCCTYDMSYRPGEDGRRETDFAEGKRYVGNAIITASRIDLNKLRRQSNVAE